MTIMIIRLMNLDIVKINAFRQGKREEKGEREQTESRKRSYRRRRRRFRRWSCWEVKLQRFLYLWSHLLLLKYYEEL